MEGYAFDESVEGVCSSLGKIRAESISPDVLHLVLVGQWGDSNMGILFEKGFIEVNKVCKAPADCKVMFGESLEVGL